jgi:excisionase family DNA binding protein
MCGLPRVHRQHCARVVPQEADPHHGPRLARGYSGAVMDDEMMRALLFGHPPARRKRVPTLTLTEAAARLGMSADTLRWQIRNGKLQAKKIGPIWTVSEKEVARYAKENRRGNVQ